MEDRKRNCASKGKNREISRKSSPNLFLGLRRHSFERIRRKRCRELINKGMCFDTLVRLQAAIKKKRLGKLSSKIFVFHYNTTPYSAKIIQCLLEDYKSDVFNHLPHSPDLTHTVGFSPVHQPSCGIGWTPVYEGSGSEGRGTRIFPVIGPLRFMEMAYSNWCSVTTNVLIALVIMWRSTVA